MSSINPIWFPVAATFVAAFLVLVWLGIHHVGVFRVYRLLGNGVQPGRPLLWAWFISFASPLCWPVAIVGIPVSLAMAIRARTLCQHNPANRVALLTIVLADAVMVAVFGVVILGALLLKLGQGHR